MPLQLRRGTTSERQSITPLISELIYDTEQKLVYVGDGVTPGGVAIDQDSSPDLALSDLNNVVIDGVSVGEIVKYNGTNWVNAELSFAGLSGVGLNELLSVGDIIKYNGTNWVNSELSFSTLPGIELNSPEVNQVLKYNGTAWTNENEDSSLVVSALDDLTNVEITNPDIDQVLIYNGTNWVNGDVAVPGTITADITGSVFATDSSIIVDAVNKVLYGSVVGNVTGDVLGDLSGNVVGNVTGDVLGDLVGSVFADDNTLLVDGINGTVPWAVISDAPAFLTEIPGSITADVKGSIFGDDSSIIVDSVNGIISIDKIITSFTLEITRANLNSSTGLSVLSDNASSRIILARTSTADISGPSISYGAVQFRRNDINGEFTTGAVEGFSNGIIFGSTDASGDLLEGGIVVSKNAANVGIGTFSPSLNANVDIRGILKLEPQSGPPAVLEEGMVAVADRTNWDPASKGSGGSYPVYYDGTIWNAFY